ncbi:hypothetical protein HDU93_002674 [Gonapodya sp. JEL0774]|nr:hypothetical protein HDU93_002674 [Gonapodya sp. JEL0774]
MSQSVETSPSDKNPSVAPPDPASSPSPAPDPPSKWWSSWGKPVASGLVATAVVTVSLPLAVTAVGFTSSGVAAGSLAAAWQSTMGGYVAAGSIFAILQSLGATGAIAVVAGWAGAALGLGVAAIVKLLQNFDATTSSREELKQLSQPLQKLVAAAEASSAVRESDLTWIKQKLEAVQREIEERQRTVPR